MNLVLAKQIHTLFFLPKSIPNFLPNLLEKMSPGILGHHVLGVILELPGEEQNL